MTEKVTDKQFKKLRNNITYLILKMNILKYIQKKKKKKKKSEPQVLNLEWNSTSLKFFITLKFMTKRQPDILRRKGKRVFNPGGIASGFNSYSRNICPSLYIPISRKKITSFLKNLLLNSILLRPTTPHET